jgi:hypothetical protein
MKAKKFKWFNFVENHKVSIEYIGDCVLITNLFGPVLNEIYKMASFMMIILIC